MEDCIFVITLNLKFMLRHFSLALSLLFACPLFSQSPCIGAAGQIVAESYYSTFDNYYQQCSRQSITFVCTNIELPDNGEIDSIQWRLNDTPIYNQHNDTLVWTAYTALMGHLYADVFSSSGCVATFQLDRPIVFVDQPNIVLDASIGSCMHEGAPLSATIANTTIESEFITFTQEAQWIESGIDEPNPLFVAGYPNPTITDCSQLRSVFINMEHSFLGDLDIEITCPNGTSVLLHAQDNSIGGIYLGEPIDDGSLTQGTGYNYQWTEEASSTITQATDDLFLFFGNTLPAGAYLPDESLCGLIGCPINGEWNMHVRDIYASDDGTLFSWGLSFVDSDNSQYDPLASAFNTYSWNSEEFNLTDQTAYSALATSSNANTGTISYSYTNTAGCQENLTKNFTIIDVEPTAVAGSDLSFIDNPNPVAESEILLLNSNCPLATFDSTICFGNNANLYHTFCASNYFDCIDVFGLTIVGETQNFDTLTIWEGTDISSEPLYHNYLPLGEHNFSTAADCFTLRIISDNFASCQDLYYAPLEISLKSHALPNITTAWQPENYFTHPDSLSSPISMPNTNTWVTVTADIPNYTGCASQDSLFVTILDNSVILTVFHDANQNGMMDEGEYAIPYFPVTAEGVGTIYTNENGQASAALDVAESFEVVIDEVQWNFTTPSFIAVDPSGWSGVAIHYFIGVTPTANLVTDIEVSLQGVTGNCNVASYPQAIVFNNANYFPGGQIHLQLDPAYTFLSSVPETISNTNNFLIYEVPPLGYHETFEVQLNLQNPPAITFGTEVTSVLSGYYYLAQGTLSNSLDADTVNLIVTCAYDPNNKITHTGEGPFNTIEANTRLEYTINFQNIGNAEAQTVILTDELPVELDPTSLQPIAWSHDFDLLLNGHTAVFTFNEIYLPGIDQDSAASMGFVRFVIDQTPNLPPSTLIENTASIVFDLNEPIITNTSVNRIADPTNIEENLATQLDVFPNPTHSVVYWNGSQHKFKRLTSMTGQELPVPQTADDQINMTPLASGIYYLELERNDGIIIRKKVVKE